MFPNSAPVRTFAGLALAVLAASVGTSAANVALPTLVDAFEAPPGQVQWVVVAYLLGMTATSVTVGYLGDRFGPRPVLLAGLGLFTGAAVASAVAPTLALLVLARAAQGVGAAVATVLPLALARDLSVDGRIGRVMGVLGATSAVGTALGPAVGGLLVGLGGWSGPFWGVVPLAAGALLLARSTPGPVATPRPRSAFDVVGGVLLTAALAVYALALTAPPEGWPTPPLLAVAGVLVAGLLVAESRAANPILAVAVIRGRSVTIGMLTNLLVATVMMATLVAGPFYLDGALGLSPALVGLVMAAGPVTSALSGVFAGRIVDRAAPPAMVTAGLLLMTVGSVGLAVLPNRFGVPGYLASLVVLTPGYQLFLAANNTQVLNDADPARRGTTAGVLGLSRNLGLITGASAMGALYTATAGDVAPASPALHETAMHTTFLVAALLASIAAAFSLLARSRQPAVVASAGHERGARSSPGR